jgi:glucuronate isomerase
MLPSIRADKAWAVDSPGYREWLFSITEATGMEITDLNGLKNFLSHMLDRFHEAGCRIADHGVTDTRFSAISEFEAESLFCEVFNRGTLTEMEAVALRSSLQAFLAAEYAHRGWTLLLHIGAERRTSSRLRYLSGPAGGYACIGSSLDIGPLCRFFDHLEEQEALPRTILFPLNPADYEMMASVTGSFAEDRVWGKIQLGPAWWHNDHYDGIRRQLRATASYSLLGRFIGMTTDSRSFLSTVRHDYFRRLLCDLVGGWVKEGSLPDDDHLLRPLIEDVCCRNAQRIVKEHLE